MEEFPERDVIDKAETLILQIRDVQSCRIATDDSGRISEIHVVAATDRQPKMIARDVDACLKAQLGLAVDYRKIGVVLIDAPSEEEPEELEEVGDDDIEVREELDDDDIEIQQELDNVIKRRFTERANIGDTTVQRQHSNDDPVNTDPVNDDPVRLEFLEDDNRARFRGLSLNINESSISVEVKLERNGIEVAGCLEAVRKSGPIYETIAGATIHALTELIEEDFQICLAGIDEVELAGKNAMVAAVDIVDGRSVRSYAGSTFVGRDPNEATVLAVLDAINRPFGRWKSIREIHYRIS